MLPATNVGKTFEPFLTLDIFDIFEASSQLETQNFLKK